MNDDFIASDPFDPVLAKQAETLTAARNTEHSEELAGFLRRRQQAYRSVFAGAAADKADLEFVMLDLASFCRAYESTFHSTNQKVQDLLEGRREVFHRLMDFTLLSHEALYIKYTNLKQNARG